MVPLKKTKINSIAKKVINLEIEALKLLKKSIDRNFDKAVNAIINCQSKIILCGVGKSGLIAAKIASTMSSVGSPSFSLSANDCLHGDMGSISKKDLLILISNSGKSEELLPIIKFANRNKVKLIGIVSKKNSSLYKGSDIKILLPEAQEAGLGIVPTSSTISQLSIGDALAVATMSKKNINKKDFKKYHPAGSLGEKLKTVEDLMLTKNKIPFINENSNMKNALRIITLKKLGTLLVRDVKGNTTGIITDGQIRRFSEKNESLYGLKVKNIMTKNPKKVEKDTLAMKALSIMNENKITSLCVNSTTNKRKTIGIVHIHNILENTSY